jgi:hypothetical protein
MHNINFTDKALNMYPGSRGLFLLFSLRRGEETCCLSLFAAWETYQKFKKFEYSYKQVENILLFFE